MSPRTRGPATRSRPPSFPTRDPSDQALYKSALQPMALRSSHTIATASHMVSSPLSICCPLGCLPHLPMCQCFLGNRRQTLGSCVALQITLAKPTLQPRTTRCAALQYYAQHHPKLVSRGSRTSREPSPNFQSRCSAHTS
jgi:hypothetical protein